MQQCLSAVSSGVLQTVVKDRQMEMISLGWCMCILWSRVLQKWSCLHLCQTDVNNNVCQQHNHRIITLNKM